MCLVTVSASYGAGGSQVAPELAQRLDVPFVDRLIHADVAAGLAGATPGDDVASSHLLARLLMHLAPIGEAYGGAAPTETASDRTVGDVTERAVFERADSGRGVILGRAGAVVLRADPRALHVRLDGPREARLQQAMRLQGIDRDTAEQRMKETDRSRYAYVRRLRRADARDPKLYHLIIDSTAVDLETCVEFVARAAEAHPGPTPAPLDPAVAAVAGPDRAPPGGVSGAS
jgi:cytidylate kinase